MKIKKARGGALFFAENFQAYGSHAAVREALSRMVKAGKLERIATGMYARPRKDKVAGKVMPTIEEIAAAIAKRDRARIVPAGTYALHRLGLTTQMPLNVVFLTDGSARRVKIGNRNILFKKASPKNLAAIGEISRLVIQALRVLGKSTLTETDKALLQQALKKENPARLAHDIRLAPVWIRMIMNPVLEQMRNG